MVKELTAIVVKDSKQFVLVVAIVTIFRVKGHVLNDLAREDGPCVLLEVVR